MLRSRSRFATAFSTARSRAWKTTAARTRGAWPISPRSSCSGRISRTTCSTSASPKRRAKRCAGSATISTKSSRRRRSPASAMADWVGSRRVTWTRSRRSKCPPSATASATSSASSIRPSATAGSARSPTNGCATATHGRSRGSEIAYEVKFGGRTESFDRRAGPRSRALDSSRPRCKGVAYDTPIARLPRRHLQHAAALESRGHRVVRLRGVQPRRLRPRGRGQGGIGDDHEGALPE